MNSASNTVGSSPGGSAFVGLNGNNQLGGTHHYSLNVNTGPMHTDPKTGYPMASPLGGAGNIHASPRAGGSLLPTAIGGTNLQQAMSGNSMPGYPHRPAGASSLNSSQLRSPITSEGYSGDKNRTGISPDTTTKDDYSRGMHSQNHPYLQNQNVHHNMPPSPHYNNGPRQQTPMRSPQQVHSSGGMGQPPGHPGRIQQQNQASFLAYSAGDVASMAPNRNQGMNYNSIANNSSNQLARGPNYDPSYNNSNMSLLSSSGVSSKPTSSSMSDASRNTMNQQQQPYPGGDISRMTDSRTDNMKNYSALDRTASAQVNLNYQSNPARNVPNNSTSMNNPRFPSYNMPTSNPMSSPAMRTAASIYSPKSNMPNSSNQNNASSIQTASQIYSSSNQQQMNYQQLQQRLNAPTSQHQNPQSQMNMQGQNSKPIPPMQQNQQTGNANQAQNRLAQQPGSGYPKNIPALALQQQKVRVSVFITFFSLL